MSFHPNTYEDKFSGLGAQGFPGLQTGVSADIRVDPVIERLVRDLLSVDEAREVLRGVYTKALHASLMKRLKNIRHETQGRPGQPGVNSLPRWRLRRVCEYIEAHIEERLTLEVLAGVAGLSRMYFAAQFRAATGLPPHEYVLRHKIERGREMLADLEKPILYIALDLGFQTQAHFTTKFKHITGYTPHQWRVLYAAKEIRAD